MSSFFYVVMELTLILSLLREGEEKYPTQPAGEFLKFFEDLNLPNIFLTA